jgi:hypothetical protein
LDPSLRKYNAEPLVWNETLATYGKNWSSGCVWKHSAGKYGESESRFLPFSTIPRDQDGS